jgi:hypothetical protein
MWAQIAANASIGKRKNISEQKQMVNSRTPCALLLQSRKNAGPVGNVMLLFTNPAPAQEA